MAEDRISLAQRASHCLAAALLAAGLLFAAIAHAVGDTFYLRLATEALIFAGLALSVELLLGCTGALSLGQAMYFGFGAYASAIVLTATQSFWAGLGAGFGVSAVGAAVGGLIANRVRGVYFALITFALAQVAGKVIYNTRALGGSDGLIGIPVVEIPLGVASLSTANAAGFFVVVALLVFALYALVALLLRTPFGRVLLALKANERRMPFLGYSVWRARMATYVIAGAIAGVAGALYPMLRGFVSPELMTFTASGNAVITVIVGGAGTLVGALYGSVILVVLKSVLSTWTEHHVIVIGALFVGIVLFMPQGLIGWLRPRLMDRLDRPTARDDTRAAAPGEKTA